MTRVWSVIAIALLTAPPSKADAAHREIPDLPASARHVFSEDWSSGKLDPTKWYVLRKKWGDGNFGVVPENVSIEADDVGEARKNVLVCAAHGAKYEGPVVGLWGKKTRVGAVVVSKMFFASGRFTVVMKIGEEKNNPDGPVDPRRPIGSVPAIWTFAYRYVEVGRGRMRDFVDTKPLYNPLMERYGNGSNEYWSELDFPEYGKQGRFERPMYNTFCQNRHDSRNFDIGATADGKYHTYVTEWHTQLEPLPGIADAQVVEHAGFWWIKDKAVPFDRYLGNPLKREAANKYSVYRGKSATHWVDGKKVGENTVFVPTMAAQLNLGIWLPDWAGPAPWHTSRVSFASVDIWQFDDPGDVRGILTDDIGNNFDKSGRELR